MFSHRARHLALGLSGSAEFGPTVTPNSIVDESAFLVDFCRFVVFRLDIRSGRVLRSFECHER